MVVDPLQFAANFGLAALALLGIGIFGATQIWPYVKVKIDSAEVNSREQTREFLKTLEIQRTAYQAALEKQRAEFIAALTQQRHEAIVAMERQTATFNQSLQELTKAVDDLARLIQDLHSIIERIERDHAWDGHERRASG